MRSVPFQSAEGALISSSKAGGALVRHPVSLRLARATFQAAVSYQKAQPNKAINLTFDRCLPSLPLRSAAVKRRLWQR